MSSKRIKSHFIKVSSQDFRPRHKNSNTPRQILRCKGHLPTSSSSKRRTNECAFSNDNYGTSIAATPAETSAAAPISDRSGPLLSVHRRHTRLDGARGYLRYGFGCALCSRLQRRLSLYGCGNFVVVRSARIHSRPVQSLGWARQRCGNAGYGTKAMRPLFSESQMMAGCLRHCAYCILCSAR